MVQSAGKPKIFFKHTQNLICKIAATAAHSWALKSALISACLKVFSSLSDPEGSTFFKLNGSGEVHCFMEYRSVPQQFLWPLESWPTSSHACATGSREVVAGRGCSSVKSVLTAVSATGPEGLMWVTQQGLFFHLSQYWNNVTAGCWKLHGGWDVKAYFSMLHYSI